MKNYSQYYEAYKIRTEPERRAVLEPYSINELQNEIDRRKRAEAEVNASIKLGVPVEQYRKIRDHVLKEAKGRDH